MQAGPSALAGLPEAAPGAKGHAQNGHRGIDGNGGACAAQAAAGDARAPDGRGDVAQQEVQRPQRGPEHQQPERAAPAPTVVALVQRRRLALFRPARWLPALLTHLAVPMRSVLLLQSSPAAFLPPCPIPNRVGGYLPQAASAVRQPCASQYGPPAA